MASTDIKLADGKGLIRGDDYTIKVTLNIDLTGATVWFTVNSDSDPASDSTAAFQKVNGPTEHEDAAAGKTYFALDGADTENLDPGAYFYDIQVENAAGKVVSTRKGNFLLDSDITRSTL